MKTVTDAQRRAVALGWGSSGLDQATYAQQHGLSARTLRQWISRYASRQPPVEQVRAIVMDAIEKLQAILEGLDVPGGMPDGDEVDVEGVLESTLIGKPDGSEDVPEIEEPSQPTVTGRLSVGAACPPPPPPAPLPRQLPRPRPVPAPAEPAARIKVNRKSFFYGAKI